MTSSLDDMGDGHEETRPQKWERVILVVRCGETAIKLLLALNQLLETFTNLAG